MRTSSKSMAIVYLIMGFLFIFMAINSTQEGGWGTITVLLAVFAALDFYVALRLLRNHLRNKINKE